MSRECERLLLCPQICGKGRNMKTFFKKNFLQYGNDLNLVFKDIGKCSIGKARNYAIELIESDFFIFLDSD